ncbi:MAG: carbamoyltransferase HypF [Sedimentisphaerales bacterium]|nr:carbamoyltransferase HypF [Sedimentisphaerales bacterium]
MKQTRCKICVAGAVQGVGFRPFVYNLAARLALTGSVTNTSEGVQIEVQGDGAGLERFKKAVISECPPPAEPVITGVEAVEPIDNENLFVIRDSRPEGKRELSITPDTATCAACLAELNDPADRRYQYPFINCTHCGPRYTIINDIPYDRPNTTMREFTQCTRCQSEYDDPGDRRFHAQPNACPACGPHVWLADAGGKSLDADKPIKQAIEFLQAGKILAIKGLGGFHLAVRADNDEAVAELRKRKYRKAKSFAIMVRDIETARQFAHVDKTAQELLTGKERPIVLCRKRPDSPLSTLVAPSSRFWGIMLPYTPLHTLLMQGDYPGLVMTSGNQTDEPIESDNNSSREKLGGIADFFLMHNRGIYTSCDDSVLRVFQSEPLMLRRARGYVPTPVILARKGRGDILALGAELKNTVTFVKDNKAFVSQHIGDLGTTVVYESFVRTVEKLGALIGARPQIIACDLHPAMLSTRFAQTYEDIQLVRVQHHHAHIAAVMGEHNLEGPVIGLAVDGIGYGSDGTIWGGELLYVWPDRIERKGHLQQIPMPGGDVASLEPWRMAVSCLIKTFGSPKGVTLANELITDIPSANINAVAVMIIKNINSPLCSSLGRFFDAVSALLGICRENTYEAQAAIELENSAAPDEHNAYPVEIETRDDIKILLIEPVMQALVKDLHSGLGRGIIAAKAHNFVVEGLTQLATELSQETLCKTVALSGGVFQNEIILSRLVDTLERKGLSVYFNRKLPVNDGCISFGQAVVADTLIRKKSGV